MKYGCNDPWVVGCVGLQEISGSKVSEDIDFRCCNEIPVENV